MPIQGQKESITKEKLHYIFLLYYIIYFYKQFKSYNTPKYKISSIIGKDSIGQQLILTNCCLIHTKSLNLHKHLQEYGIPQRISQSMDRENSPINCLLEQAACIVRRSKATTRTLEPTESYKGGQIEELKSFADSLNLWTDFNNYPVIYLDKGGENEVFYDGAATIYKLNNFEYAGDDLENFFIRIFAHNRFFNNVPYSLIGFSYNSQKEFCAVLTQPYIKAEREATEDEITEHMQALGFEMDYYDEFHNDEYEIFDAVPNNVLYGIDGALYFIDTQIRLREEW